MTCLLPLPLQFMWLPCVNIICLHRISQGRLYMITGQLLLSGPSHTQHPQATSWDFQYPPNQHSQEWRTPLVKEQIHSYFSRAHKEILGLQGHMIGQKSNTWEEKLKQKPSLWAPWAVVCSIYSSKHIKIKQTRFSARDQCWDPRETCSRDC